mgnify:FL=1
MTATPAQDQLDADARRMAREGLGYEDLFVRLWHRGATGSYCRMIVFADASAVLLIRQHMATDMSKEPT